MGDMGSTEINKWIQSAAKQVGVDRHDLGKAVEQYKEDTGCKYTNLSYKTIVEIAEELKRGLIHV